MGGMHDQLISAIEDWNPVLQGTVDRQTPLITSGRLDSLGLLRLLMWIEQRIGRSIDVSEIDMVEAWDDVDGIVRFVERERRRR
jgi:acyl carrier protein